MLFSIVFGLSVLTIEFIGHNSVHSCLCLILRPFISNLCRLPDLQAQLSKEFSAHVFLDAALTVYQPKMPALPENQSNIITQVRESLPSILNSKEESLQKTMQDLLSKLGISAQGDFTLLSKMLALSVNDHTMLTDSKFYQNMNESTASELEDICDFFCAQAVLQKGERTPNVESNMKYLYLNLLLSASLLICALSRFKIKSFIDIFPQVLNFQPEKKSRSKKDAAAPAKNVPETQTANGPAGFFDVLKDFKSAVAEVTNFLSKFEPGDPPAKKPKIEYDRLVFDLTELHNVEAFCQQFISDFYESGSSWLSNQSSALENKLSEFLVQVESFVEENKNKDWSDKTDGVQLE